MPAPLLPPCLFAPCLFCPCLFCLLQSYEKFPKSMSFFRHHKHKFFLFSRKQLAISGLRKKARPAWREPSPPSRLVRTTLMQRAILQYCNIATFATYGIPRPSRPFPPPFRCRRRRRAAAIVPRKRRRGAAVACGKRREGVRRQGQGIPRGKVSPTGSSLR